MPEWKKPEDKKPSTLLQILEQLKIALEMERDKHQQKINELHQMANSALKHKK